MKGLRARGSFFMGYILYGCSCQVVGNVADTHHIDADPDPDLDPACHFDPDPSFHFDADPDPSFQKKTKNLEKVLK
jgi:hypothetical protein